MGKKVYIGDNGTELILDTNEDMTNSITRTIKVRKGDGTITEWTNCSFSALEPTQIKYVITSDDLSCSGIYKVQAYIVLNTGWSGLGETAEFQVYAAFE